MKKLVLPALLLLASAAAAQTTRIVRDTHLWPELQGEVALKNGDYLLLALRGERSTTSDVYVSRRLGFDAGRVGLSYEHFWNARWSWGGGARLQSARSITSQLGSDLLVPELLLRHRSPIFGGITLGQRLSAEYQIPLNYPLGGSGLNNQVWGRLRLDAERLFPLSSDAATGLALRPRLSYEAYTHLRLQKADNDRDERTIQFTSLRGEVGVRVSPTIDLTPWFAYQTAYEISLPQYDANGNQVRGGKYNDIYPTFGLDLRFTLVPAGTKADRQQLPTQH